MSPAGFSAPQPAAVVVGSRGEPPPDPAGADSWSELSQRLRLLRAWAGVSYRELHRRVLRLRRERGVPELPVYNTIYRCLQPGRARIDPDLVADIVWVLLNDETAVAAWRQACAVIAGEYDAASIVTVTTELPPAPRGFTGRRAPLRRLLRCAEALAPDRPTVCAVIGMPGAGKTTLVVHALHRLWAYAPEPTTLLYVDLRGSQPERQPAEPAAVLDGMLRALGATGRELLPLDLPARRATLDRLVAQRRIVIVLDDAVDSGPGAPDHPAPRAVPGADHQSASAGRAARADRRTRRVLRRGGARRAARRRGPPSGRGRSGCRGGHHRDERPAAVGAGAGHRPGACRRRLDAHRSSGAAG